MAACLMTERVSWQYQLSYWPLGNTARVLCPKQTYGILVLEKQLEKQNFNSLQCLHYRLTTQGWPSIWHFEVFVEPNCLQMWLWHERIFILCWEIAFLPTLRGMGPGKLSVRYRMKISVSVGRTQKAMASVQAQCRVLGACACKPEYTIPDLISMLFSHLK